MNFLQEIDDRHRLRGVVLFILSFLFVAYFSCWTSFLTPFCISDSCVFSVMGKGWAHGLVPYRDLFDHKGPFVYLFYAAAAIDDGQRFYLTLLQALFMTANACLIYRMARLFTSPACAWLTLAATCVLLPACAQSAVLTEELSLPFSLAPLFLLLSHGTRNHWKMSQFPYLGSAVFGACLGAIFMIRINNAIVVCCCIFVLLLSLLIQKRFSCLLKHSLVMAVACAAVLAPVCFYFIYQEAWDDFLWGNLLFNLKYACSGSIYNLLDQIIRCVFIFPLLCFGLLNRKLKLIDTTTYFVILFIAFSSIATSSMGLGYWHYTITALPAFSLTIVLLLKLVERAREEKALPRLVAGVALIALSLSPFCRLTLRYAKLSRDAILYAAEPNSKAYGQYSTRQAILGLSKHIPENERDGVFAFNGFGEVYEYLGILPHCKYFMLHDMFNGMTRGMVEQEVLSYMDKDQPKWIYVQKGCKFLKQLREERYQEVDCQGSFTLFKLRLEEAE